MPNYLTYRTTLDLTPIEPFSFERSFYSPSRFPSRLEYVTDDKFYTILNLAVGTFGLKYYMQSKRLFLDIYTEKILDKVILGEINVEVKFRLSLGMNYLPFYEQYANDDILREIVVRNYGKRIISIYSLYENLMISTFLQNTTIQRTVSMCQNMLEKYGKLIVFDGVELFALWQPQEMIATEADLRALKVGYRAKNILRITNYFRENQISEQKLRCLPTESLEKDLLKIYGVGKQTVFYIMLGQFHRTEYLRHLPLWERKILSRYLFDQELCGEENLVSWFRERYGKWCSFAFSMIWEDIFHQYQKKPFPWLKKIMREK